MNENTKPTTPLLEDASVQELLKVLTKSKSTQVQALMLLVGQVSALEGHLAQAETELQAMRRELHGLRLDSKAQAATQEAVTVVQGNILTLRDCVSVVKQDIVHGCKNALTAFKENGLAALNGLAGFFHIKEGLAALGNALDRSIQAEDRAVAKIEAVSQQYHEAGRHLKNAARAVAGREIVQQAKPVGKLAKGLQAPHKARRSGLARMKQDVDKALGSLARLEQAAPKRQLPSIHQTLDALNKEIAQAPVKQQATPQRQPEGR